MKKNFILLTLAALFCVGLEAQSLFVKTSETNWPAVVAYLLLAIAATCALISKFFVYDSKSNFEQYNTVCGMITASVGLGFLGYDLFYNQDTFFKVLDVLMLILVIASRVSQLNPIIVVLALVYAITILFFSLDMPKLASWVVVGAVCYIGIFILYRRKLPKY